MFTPAAWQLLTFSRSRYGLYDVLRHQFWGQRSGNGPRQQQRQRLRRRRRRRESDRSIDYWKYRQFWREALDRRAGQAAHRLGERCEEEKRPSSFLVAKYMMSWGLPGIPRALNRGEAERQGWVSVLSTPDDPCASSTYTTLSCYEENGQCHSLYTGQISLCQFCKHFVLLIYPCLIDPGIAGFNIVHHERFCYRCLQMEDRHRRAGSR